MKTFTKLLVVILFVFDANANAQITLQKTYPGEGSFSFQWVYLEHSGFKYVYWHSDTLTFYNLNYSLFRNAVFPDSLNSDPSDIEFISEGLFETDTSHIDFMVFYETSSSESNYAICRDDGTEIFSEDSAEPVGAYSGMGAPVFYPIYNSDSGTFMLIDKGLYPPFNEEIYKLPGSLPCIPGCSGNNIVTEMPHMGGSGGTMNVYPNPTNNYSNIFYSLPPGTNEGEIIVYDLAGREVKRYTVTRQVDHLQLSTSDIRAGTYFYQLMVNGNNISTKKIVVVK